MKTNKITILLLALTSILLFTSASWAQVPASYQCSIRNDSLTSSTVYEFDIYLQNTDLSNVFEFDLFQAGILVNPSIVNGGTVTASIIAGSSQLVAAQQPASITFSAAQNCIKIGPGGVVPHGSATIISTTAPGTKIARVRLTNSVSFGIFAPNFSFNFTATPYNTAVIAYDQTSPFLGVNITNSADHTVSTMTNPILNAPVTAFSMTGGGADCSGTGVAVGLSGSETGVLYQLLKNSVPVGSYVAGTGSAISFGLQTVGTYTATAYRKATYLTGIMTGSAVVTGSGVLPTLIGLTSVCAGTAGNVYTTETGMSNYTWSVSAGGSITAGGTSTSNTVTITWNTAGAQTVSVNYTNAACTAASPTVYNVTVNPNIAVSVAIAASSNPVCSGSSVTLTATPTNGGTLPAYQWKVNGVNAGTNSSTYSYIPLNNDAITCVLTSNIACPTGNPATSNTVTMTVNTSSPVSVAIAASSNPVCSGSSVTFTATPTNGGTLPAYQWKVNGVNAGTNSSTYSYIPLNNDAVTCVLTSNLACPTGNPATSNTVTMTVNSTLPIIVAIAASSNPVCSGSSVTFTATPTNGGTLPAYQWKVNGVNAGTNSSTYSYIPLNNDAVACVLTSNIACPTGSPATSNTVTMTVNSTLPVSVAIAASSNPVCSGSSVTFTATPTNGGTLPAYQWKVDGVNTGTNSSTYSYIPLNNDAVTCILTSNTSCAIGSPATSNTVTMTVNSTLPVSVAIAASSNPVCSGSSVTFTATPTNGGTLPAYQWKVNGVNAGTNSSTYSYIPLNNDAITCVLTSNIACATGNPATSNTVTMTVNSTLPVSIGIAASSNPVCSGSSVTFTATPTNGGTLAAYQWKVNGVNAGTNSSTYSYIPLNNDAITCVLTSNIACPTGNPATSNTVTITVNTSSPVNVAIAASSNPVCSSSSVTFTATPTNGGTLPAYQWKVNGVNAGTNSSTYSYIPLNNDAITCVLTSNIACPTGNPATSNTVTMTVNTSSPVSVAIAASSNPVCSGSSVTFIATPTNGGTLPSYQWKVNGVNAGTNSSTYSYIPLNNDAVTCVLTSNTSCATGSPATSNTVSMTVNSTLPVSVAIAASSNPVCSGSSVTLTATPTNGGTLPAYQWKVNGVNAGTNSSTYSYIPLNNDAVTCVLTSNTSCATGSPATSNTVTMTVNSTLPVSVAIAASSNPVCSGSSVTFTATPTNGGTLPAYQWKVNGVNAGTNSSTYSYIPLNNDAVTCVLTSNLACPTGNPATSNTVTMTVNSTLPVSVAIAASSNPVCSGSSVTFTATPTNGGTLPAYQWKVNGVNAGTNSSTYSYIPLNNDAVTCVLTSNIACPTGNPTTSNTVTMTVNSTLPVIVAIAASSNPVCSGSSVTFTATPTNGGTLPAYQWKVNGVNAGTNSSTYSYIPLNNDAVTCVLTSNLACPTGNPATSNTVTMTVNSTLPVSVAIAASSNPVCSGSSVTFTATPTNGGTLPAYQWKVNGVNAGTNSSIYSYIPLNNDAVTCVLTSNTSCATGNPATSNTVTMTVNSTLPVSVAIAASSNPVCSGFSVTFTATPTNGGTLPAYQWKVNGVNAGTNSSTYSYIPLNNDAVTCVLTSNLACQTGNPTTSNTVTMTVNSMLPVSVTIAASSTNICSGNPVTFTATPTNGGTNPFYQWQVNGTNAGTNSTTFSYMPVFNDAITCVMTSNANCASGNPATSNEITLTVNPDLPVSVTIGASSNPVCTGNTVTFTATPFNGGSAPTYQWQVNGINAGTNNSTFSYIPLNNDAVTCKLTSNAACATGNPANSNMITMAVNSSLPVSVATNVSSNPICSGNPVTFTATPTNGGTTPTYQWLVNGVSVGTNSPTYSYIPLNNDAVTCLLTSNATCATGSPAISNQIVMSVTQTIHISVDISASTSQVCEGTSVTFTATPTNGGTAPSYQWQVNGVNAGTNSPTFSYSPSNKDSVVCILTTDPVCAVGSPATSNMLTMIVNAIPSAPVVTLSHDTLSSTSASGNQWYTTTGLIPGATSQRYVVTSDGLYWSKVTSNNCTSANSDTVNVVLTGIEGHAVNSIIEVYPNPNSGQFNVAIMTTMEKHFDLLIYHSLGSLVYEEKGLVVNGNFEQNVDISSLPSGIYYLIFRNSDGDILRKIILEK